MYEEEGLQPRAGVQRERVPWSEHGTEKPGQAEEAHCRQCLHCSPWFCTASPWAADGSLALPAGREVGCSPGVQDLPLLTQPFLP